jgi:signal transduction histidine kinase
MRQRSIFGKGKKGLKSEGAGIGLYLVETLIYSYDGDVWIEDDYSKGHLCCRTPACG